jgi:methylated-DNA-[protein]-cysteine S-methyltransferase
MIAMAANRITVKSPLGPLTVIERDGRIAALDYGAAGRDSPTPLLLAAAQQLDAYFHCSRKTFDLPLAPAGTPFQQSVWQAMRRIPYGRTSSYADMARELDSGPRAIGGACGRNPIPIIIPCHRVLASGQRIGGYSSPGGLDTKRFLLRLEGVRLAA